MSQPEVSIILKTLALGGAERAVVNLAREFCQQGVKVDLVVTKKRGMLLPEVSKKVRIFELGKGSTLRTWPILIGQRAIGWRHLPAVAQTGLPSLVRRLPSLRDYFANERPVSVLASTPNCILSALWARDVSSYKPRIVIREASTISLNSKAERTAFGRIAPELARQWYPRAEGIVAVSAGAGQDLARVIGVPDSRIMTIHNAIDVDRVRTLASQSPEEAWLTDGGPPVLVTVGGLHEAKDHATLLKAFAKVVATRPCRLIIVGEGALRAELEQLKISLGLTETVKLVGAKPNPFSYIARSKTFVLSSAWEGFPNVLLEALACGCPIVSTDCRNGPSEILDAGRFGRLVPVKDQAALADALIQTMGSPVSVGAAQVKRAHDFDPRKQAKQYLKLLLA